MNPLDSAFGVLDTPTHQCGTRSSLVQIRLFNQRDELGLLVDGPAVPSTSIQFDWKFRLFIRSSLTCLIGLQRSEMGLETLIQMLGKDVWAALSRKSWSSSSNCIGFAR